MRRQRAWPTADVKHLIARADPGKCRKDLRKRLGISAHETGIRLRRDDKTHRAMLCRETLHGACLLFWLDSVKSQRSPEANQAAQVSLLQHWLKLAQFAILDKVALGWGSSVRKRAAEHAEPDDFARPLEGTGTRLPC